MYKQCPSRHKRKSSDFHLCTIHPHIPTPISNTKKVWSLFHLILWSNVIPLFVWLIVLSSYVLKSDCNWSCFAHVWDFVGRRKHILISFSLSQIEIILFLPQHKSFSLIFFLGLTAGCEHEEGAIFLKIRNSLFPPLPSPHTHSWVLLKGLRPSM